MSTKEIAPGEWKAFFDSFSRRHDGWLVTIEALSPELGAQIEVSKLPLRGVSVEPANDGPEEFPANIELLFIARDGGHLSHTIDAPARVWLKQNEHGSDQVLEVEARSGNTLLYFRSPLPTEMVDAVER